MAFFVTPSGRKIYYERYGLSGPPVILIHGLASSSRIWFRQKRILKNQFRVYLLDLPGHGRSDSWPEYSIAECVEVTRQWMDHCRIDQAHLVALSIGCSVALTLAAEAPERVRSLVLSGPVGGYHDKISVPLGAWDWFSFTMLPHMIALSTRMFGSHRTAYWLNSYGVQAKSTYKLLDLIQTRADFKAIRQLLWDSVHPPYVGQLEHVTSKVMLIRGETDPISRRFSDYILANLPTASQVEVPEARHIVSLEKPEDFNQLMIHFLRTGIA